MVSKVGPQDNDLIIKFGAGLNTRASEEEITPREAADGKNFLLDKKNRQLRNRKPFDLVATATNGLEIRGGGSLLKADGTVSTVIQAGTDVYDWDGSTGFTDVGNVGATAKLRGHWRTHNWTLGDKLLLTDLSLVEVVKEWDGTTLSNVAFLSNPSTSFGTFFAKYLSVSNERAMFAHVKDSGATTRHMIVGSKRADYTTLSVSDRPSSALSEEDPFFLLSPDLRPINGIVEAFGSTIISSEKGQIFNLTGSSSKDFAFDDFYPGSAASGDESLAYIGTDIIYGRQGRVESIRDTDRFGDSEASDLTDIIADLVEDYTGWQIVYNSRLNRVYMFPTGQSEVWVFQTAMLGGEESAFMRWETSHSLAFQPTFVQSMLDPMDGLEYVFMGDSSGNIYRMEGSGTAGDGGSAEVTTEWLTKLYSLPVDAQAYNIEGWVKYRKDQAATVSLTFEYAGEAAFNESITIDIPAIATRPLYGNSLYYNSDVHYGTASGRLLRQKFTAPGQGNEFQVRVQVSGTTNFDINEIGLRFAAASQ